MACDWNRDANFSDSGKISATKWGKYSLIAAQKFAVPEWRLGFSAYCPCSLS